MESIEVYWYLRTCVAFIIVKSLSTLDFTQLFPDDYNSHQSSDIKCKCRIVLNADVYFILIQCHMQCRILNFLCCLLVREFIQLFINRQQALGVSMLKWLSASLSSTL